MSEKNLLLVKNAEVMDGINPASFKGDIIIEEGKIMSIRKSLTINTGNILDADGLLLCPGFIDIHSHSDMSLHFDNRLESSVRQGITTSVVGNCGSSLAPVNDDRLELFRRDIELFSPPEAKLDITWRSFSEYLDVVEKLKISTNIVPLVGFGTIRIAGGPGYEDRPPTQDELVKMQSYVDEAMKSGAFGMSTGLIYSPQVYSQTDEIIELAKVVAKYQGLYFSHIRGEGETVVQAIQELIEIVEKSGCKGGQIAHHKIAGRPFWGTSKATLKLIEQANDKGLDITCDQYPYNRGMTSLISVLPPWVHIGGIDAILERLENPEICNRIIHDIKQGLVGWENMIQEAGLNGIYISSIKTEKWKGVEGKSIAEIQIDRGYQDGLAMLFELLLDEKGEVSMTIESMGQEDIRRIMKSPFTLIGTDAWGVSPKGIMSHGKPHPRFYGTYPRILGKYVREVRVLKLHEAISKMTSLPARKLGLRDRGIISEGFWADFVLFNPNTIIDKATYTDPHRFPEGIHYVAVNGNLVIEKGELNDCLPGKVIRHAS